MKRAMVLMAAIIAVVAYQFVTTEADCYFCNTGVCYSSASCGNECICMSKNSGDGGTCVHFDLGE